MTEESIKENIKFINEYTLDDWINTIKDIFIDFKLFVKDEEVEYVYSQNNYTVKYENNLIDDIIIYLKLKYIDEYTKCHLSSCFLDFEKSIGGGRYEITNRIPIYALRIFK